MPTNRIRVTAQPTPPEKRPRGADALERLYVYWLLSSILFLILILTVSIVLATRTSRHADQIEQARQQSQELQTRLADMENRIAGLKAALAAARTQPTAAPSPPTIHAPTSVPSEPISKPTVPASTPVPQMTEADLNARLDELLGRSTPGDHPPRDSQAARGFLATALDAHGDGWSNHSWLRLTALAAWLGDPSAELLAAKVTEAAQVESLLAEISCRKLLRTGPAPQALAQAQQLVEKFGGTTSRRLLLAQCAAAIGDPPASADLNRFLDEFGAPGDMSFADAVALGGLLVDQQRWSELAGLVENMPPAPTPSDALEAETLRVASAIQSGRAAEVRDRLAALAKRSPGDDRILLWLGVAQFQLREYEAARVTLQFVEDHSLNPADWYWRAMVEVNGGNAQSAAKYLQRSLSFGGGYAPAWEALGTLAINRGDWTEAQTDLASAIDSNPGRAGAHFLMAIAHAAAGRREDAAKSLNVALLLDHELLGAARRVEAFKRFFDDRELQRLATTQPAEGP